MDTHIVNNLIKIDASKHSIKFLAQMTSMFDWSIFV
jgi:hypothetical protein